jgi:hypothetical protein
VVGRISLSGVGKSVELATPLATGGSDGPGQRGAHPGQQAGPGVPQGKQPSLNFLLKVANIFHCEYYLTPFCGSGIRCLFDPFDPGWVKNQDPDPG